jgi:SpoVK/Ycf46/Vps4 family AAA+-type ATPase
MVGESEQRTRDVLKQIDAQRGCVLVIDEADKALGNAHSSQGDSGVTRRVFGTILTWLAENKSKTFCIMTLNRTEGLPPELTRAGRFDAMFYTDLPNDAERRLILEIHLRKRDVVLENLGLKDGDWAEILKATEGFVGSELEEVVKSARYLALEEAHNAGGELHGNPSFDNLIEAIGATVPLTQRDPEGMDKIRDYCKGKAQPVTTPTKKSSRKGRSRSVKVDQPS